MTDIESVQVFLQSLDDKDLVRLLQEVFVLRRNDKIYETGDFQYDDVMCLALCSFGSFNGKVDSKAIIELYASEGDGEKENNLCEQGVCPTCKSELISASKTASCPICRSNVFLT